MLTVGLIAGAAILTSACGPGSGQPDTAPCAIAADATSSDGFLTPKTTQQVYGFLSEGTCSKVSVRAISMNSIGEDCTVGDVAVTLRAADDNAVARKAEIQSRIVPRVTRNIAKVTECVQQSGRGQGTDVVGVFTAISSLVNGDKAHVLVVSDMVQNVGVDLQHRDLAGQGVATTATRELVAALPTMDGWQITVAGLGTGTTHMAPAHSAALHQVWQDALSQKGAKVNPVGV
ncbi:MAG: hypothetical protein WAV90_07650 [Gordonia amarae]